MYFCLAIFPIVDLLGRSNLLPPVMTAASALLWMGRVIEGGGHAIIKKNTHWGLDKSSSNYSTLASNLSIGKGNFSLKSDALCT
jgi:hypothetical protein